MTISQLDRVKGCFLGVAIGDALGQPVESLSASEIKELVGEVTTYIDPVQQNVADTMKLKAGDTTDDFQLTKVLADSFIDSGKFDIVDIALKHVHAFETSSIGWGRSTYNGVKQLKTFFDTRGKKGRSIESSLINYETATNNSGAGNGVAMKIAPYALFYVLSNREIDFDNIEKDITNIAGLTHSDPRAAIAAIHVCTEIMLLIDDKHCYPDLNHSYKLETKIKNKDFSEKLSLAIVCPEEELIDKIGVGCFCLESVPTAMIMACRYLSDFKTGMIKTINLGGDADSTGSIFGAIVGANVGIQGIPQEWILPQHEEIIKLAERFYQVALDSKPRRIMGGFGRI